MPAMISGPLASLRAMVSGNKHKYKAIPTPVIQQQPRTYTPERLARMIKFTMGGMALVAVLFMMISLGRSAPIDGCEQSGSCTDISPHIWGQYSPFFSVPSAIDPSVPQGCKLTFAQVLSRHGSRAPTKGKRDKYKKVVDRIQKSVTNFGHGYEFIQSYSFNLGSNDLTLFGEKELVKSGETFYQRYKDLSSDSHPFIRAAGSDRVIRSAQNFTQGFYKLQGKDAASHIAEILVISEEVGANNTLNHGGCSAFEDGPLSELSDEIQDTWMNIWVPPIMQRLNEKMLGANLTLQETIYMMDLCPFNTIATPNATISDFCRLFSQGEWRSYDYYQSLGKWYGHGQGNALGPTQGVGFANELISRLTGSPVNDHTSINSTLDTSPITFPLNKTLYADFSHDNDMTSIYAALGLYSTTEDLPVKYKISPVKAKGYSAAWTVPFAGRMYVEKMVCKSGGKTGEELVRVLVNDRVLPLLGCGADRLGRCRLSAFVKGLSFAQSGGHWDQCFA